MAATLKRPLGVILAGGLARRMGGGDKGFLNLGGSTILENVIERFAPQVERFAINANGDPERFSNFCVPVISDSIDGFAGPLAGVLAGLDWAAGEGAEFIVTAAADTPFLPTDLVSRLQLAASKVDSGIALAATVDPKRGVVRQPTFGHWPINLRDDLRDALNGGLRKVVLWTDQHGAGQEVFSTDPLDPFFNVNTPEDFEKAKEIMATKAK